MVGYNFGGIFQRNEVAYFPRKCPNIKNCERPTMTCRLRLNVLIVH